MWDTPGLGDPFGDDEATVKEIAEKCKPDLLVYSLDIQGRFGKDDAIGIKLLTEAIGPQMWKHAIIALTFANTVEARGSRDDVTCLGEKISSFTLAIERFMKEKLQIPHDITTVPTGYRNYQPPGIDD